MSPPADILPVFLRFRLDAALFLVVSVIAAVWCRRWLKDRSALADFPQLAWFAALGLVAAGISVAEWVASELVNPIGTGLSSLVLARCVALVTVAFLVAIVLSHASLIALMRAKNRQHAQTESELEKARTAADQAGRAKSDFLSVMSHEIRTPLNAVMGFANLLAETRLDEPQRDYVGTITSEGRRLTSLVTDILDLNKIEEGQLALERVPFSPVETAHEVLRLLSPRASEKKIDIRFEAQVAGPLLVSGDPIRFRQILLNLVDNAIKFTARGSVTVFMGWTAPGDAGQPGRIGVRIADTGVGIAPEKLKDLFQLFMQADNSTTRRHGGIGLGLALSQRLIGMMGGEIRAESTLHVGTVVAFELQMTPVAPPQEIAPPAAAVRSPSAPRPRVLVVDDMDTNRVLMEIFLTRNGFDTELAASGSEAVQLAATKKFDAILMDLQMPDVDGLTATRQIRQAENEATRTPIIALTASITSGTREKCLAAGMDDYLTKPLDLRKFKGILDQFIARAPAARAMAALAVATVSSNA